MLNSNPIRENNNSFALFINYDISHNIKVINKMIHAIHQLTEILPDHIPITQAIIAGIVSIFKNLFTFFII